MHRKEFDIQARRLTRSQDKFVASMYSMFDVAEGLSNQMSTFGKYLEAFQEMLDAHSNSLKALIDAYEGVLKAFTESSVTINENSARLEKLISRVDSYFGSEPGLDYDN